MATPVPAPMALPNLNLNSLSILTNNYSDDSMGSAAEDDPMQPRGESMVIEEEDDTPLSVQRQQQQQQRGSVSGYRASSSASPRRASQTPSQSSSQSQSQSHLHAQSPSPHQHGHGHRRQSSASAGTGSNAWIMQPAPADVVVNNYKLDRTLGQGTFGKVKLGLDLRTGEKVAIKIIDKAQLKNERHVQRIHREIRFLRLLNHPHIVKVYEVHETATHIYIAMEYIPGGELFDYIVAHKKVKEVEARSFFRQILSAIDYCHQNCIIHRDLKPENVLLNASKTIKIIDFGFGNNFRAEGLLDTFCGSPFYAAPEMILGKRYNGPEVDMWSLGITLFALLCGHLPFDHKDMQVLYARIARGEYVMPPEVPAKCQHLISRMITVDPLKRATLQEVRQHEWVNEGFAEPPQSFIPASRSVAAPVAAPDAHVVKILLSFSYAAEEVAAGLAAQGNNPIKATYHLIAEMHERERRLPHAQAAARKSSLSPVRLSHQSLGSSSGQLQQQPQFQSLEKLRVPSPSEAALHAAGNGGRPLASTSTMVAMLPLPPAAVASAQGTGARKGSTTSGAAPAAIRASAFTSMPAGLDSRQQGGNGRVSAPPPPSSANGSAQQQQQQQQLRKQSLTPQPFVAPGAASQARAVLVRRASARPDSPAAKVEGTSVNVASAGGAAGEAEPRSVSGWFVTFQTTSAKPAADIMQEIVRVLRRQRVLYAHDPRGWVLNCAHAGEDGPGAAEAGHSEPRRGSLLLPPSSPTGNNNNSNNEASGVEFQIEVCRIPRLNLHGVIFKRMSGSVWDYKKLSTALISEVQL